jgi:hypothetical protein
MDFGTNCHDVKFRGVWGVADDREKADRMSIVHGDQGRAPIGDASILLIRLGFTKPVRHSRQELGADRAASRLEPDEPHRATLAHRSTTPGVILPLAKRRRANIAEQCLNLGVLDEIRIEEVENGDLVAAICA